ncbi:TPA: translation initiation factor IF-2 subunit beta [archaeon]|uniref:Translation initiation factor IF-2 subunit beta n=1 Tax=Candidatus Naiadarchaeum limnaeum TaxID=2756139 RepID=A0A832V4T9_9ARCH|nr:translation initiation factor IF-2 subunit beta [Candidatus Naiadarchaeum limnaeum]
MVWNYTYDEMLERVYSQLPVSSKEEVRFELPQIKSVLSGNKTVVSNLPQLASTFRRSVEHLLKFMLRELATTGEQKGSEFVFVGKFRQEFLQDKINKYAKEFVLCHQCGKPDTNLLKEAATTFLICEACGARESLRTLK